jgi:hypothetical protein
VEGASFLGAIGLTVEQIREAEGWEQAHFDKEFLQKLKAAKEQEDIPDETISPPET